jgi:hypothetical protein
MKQQIALQRALLALQREDEQIRMRTMPQATQPALARGLGGGKQAYAGPTSALAKEKEPAFKGGMEYSPITTSWRPGAGSLEEALRAAKPATGSAIDFQAEAWAKRKEIVEGRVVGAKEAYDRIITLDPAGQKVALDTLRKYKPEVYKAMEKEGLLSPAGTLVKQQKKALNVSTWTDEDGWLQQTTVFEDGTTETEIIGRGAKEPAEEPSVSDMVALEKLGMEVTEFNERHVKAAVKVMGDKPRVGIDTLTIDGKDVLATVEHEKAWYEGVALAAAVFAAEAGEAPPEGEVKMDDVKARYAGRPDLISDIQQQLGIPVTGVWDEETERQFYLYGPTLEGEPTVEEGETKPKFNRQKKFWDTWFKTWGRVFTTKGLNIAGQTQEEWKAAKGGE